MRILSWNVAGLRACMNKGFRDVILEYDPDIVCLQEVKALPEQVELNLPIYTCIWNAAEKRGYSGTLVMTKKVPEDWIANFGPEEFCTEGRVITVQYPQFYLVTSYTPNSQELLKRLRYRLRWEECFQAYLQRLDANNLVILCGDLNVAHQKIDIANPAANMYSPGFSKEEREAFSCLLSKGFCDSYRELHPNTLGAYTYWSYRGNARSNNVGWRLDYFVVSQRIMKSVVHSEILSDVQGSDHCPILLDINL